jgi:hypothetical protein
MRGLNMLTIWAEYGYGSKALLVAALPRLGDELIIVDGPTVRITHVKVYAWSEALVPADHPHAIVTCTY